MKQMNIKSLIFDIGGVLIDWNPRYLYQKIFKTEFEMEWFLQHVTTEDWNSKQDAGRSFETAILERIALFPEYSNQIEAYYDRWAEMIGGEIQESVQILEQVKNSGYPLYALTNWSAQTLPIARKMYGFFDLFDGIVVSGTEKLIKPDPQIYHVLMNRYGISPDCTIFIDDNKSNIKSAKKLGFETIHFKTSQQLGKTLELSGVLNSEDS